MGLYDVVRIPVECPFCGRIVEDWQTKDLDRMMDYYRINDRLPMENGNLSLLTHCPHRIRRSYGILAQGLYEYRLTYVVWMYLTATVRHGYLDLDDVRSWRMVAEVKHPGHCSIALQYVSPRRFNWAKKKRELQRIGKRIEDVVGVWRVDLKWDCGVVRTKIAGKQEGVPNEV